MASHWPKPPTGRESLPSAGARARAPVSQTTSAIATRSSLGLTLFSRPVSFAVRDVRILPAIFPVPTSVFPVLTPGFSGSDPRFFRFQPPGFLVECRFSFPEFPVWIFFDPANWFSLKKRVNKINFFWQLRYASVDVTGSALRYCWYKMFTNVFRRRKWTIEECERGTECELREYACGCAKDDCLSEKSVFYNIMKCF